MATELDVDLTEEAAEDLLYYGRTGDLDELKDAIHAFAERRGGQVSLDTVSTLLSQVQQRTSSHNSPLHYAAANGHEDVVQYLVPLCTLSALLAQNESGNTALHWAAFNGRMKVVKLLVDRIESLIATGPSNGKFTSEGTQADTRTEQEIDAEAEKEARKRSIWDVVNKAGRGPMSEAQMNGKEDVVDFLLQRMVTAPSAKEESMVADVDGDEVSDKVEKLDLEERSQS